MYRNPPKKILLIQTAFIGDVILVTPLINGLKMIFPDALIDVVVVPQCEILLENNPNVHEIHCFNKRKNKLQNLLKLINAIKDKRFDLSVSPHSSLPSGLISFLARIPYRIGFKRNLQQYLLTKSIIHAPISEHKHKIVTELSLLKILPLELKERKPIDNKYLYLIDKNGYTYDIPLQTTLYPTAENDQKAEEVFGALPENKGVIVLTPGSVWFTKRWSMHRFRVLAERLVEQGFAVLLSGSASEYDICDYIQCAVQTRYPEKTGAIVCVAGKFNLLDSAALIGRVSLVVCNDSGTLHIANAMATPVFALFGPTTQNIGYFPFGERDFVFEVELDCRPCGRHGGKRCPKGHHNCMQMISVDTVFEKVLEFFDDIG